MRGSPQELRDHFAQVLLELVGCYKTENNRKAVLLIDSNEVLVTMAINATESDVVDVLIRASDIFLSAQTVDAPPKEMFN